ncbi:MAG: PIN domain-containing protein, partial [Dehalococcoidia bacterium]|nr:PIN domain-containing protein [Dehalococcoidia bacterium]
MKASLFLVDTSVWLEVLPAGKSASALRERVDTLLREDRVATSGMVMLELLGGSRNDGEYNRLRAMFSAVHALDVDASTWWKASRLAFEVRRKGLTIPFTDLLIATVAMQHDAAVLHRDRHFDALAHHA